MPTGTPSLSSRRDLTDPADVGVEVIRLADYDEVPLGAADRAPGAA